MGRLTMEFDPSDMTEEEIEKFRKAPIIEKVCLCRSVGTVCWCTVLAQMCV